MHARRVGRFTLLRADNQAQALGVGDVDAGTTSRFSTSRVSGRASRRPRPRAAVGAVVAQFTRNRIENGTRPGQFVLLLLTHVPLLFVDLGALAVIVPSAATGRPSRGGPS